MIKINLFVIKLASGDRMFFWQVEEEMMMHKLCELMVTHRKNLKVCSDPIQRSFEGLLNELVFYFGRKWRKLRICCKEKKQLNLLLLQLRPNNAHPSYTNTAGGRVRPSKKRFRSPSEQTSRRWGIERISNKLRSCTHACVTFVALVLIRTLNFESIYLLIKNLYSIHVYAISNSDMKLMK